MARAAAGWSSVAAPADLSGLGDEPVVHSGGMSMFIPAPAKRGKTKPRKARKGKGKGKGAAKAPSPAPAPAPMRVVVSYGRRGKQQKEAQPTPASPVVTPVHSPEKPEPPLLATETAGTPLFLLAHGNPSTVRSEFGTPSKNKKPADSAPAAGTRRRRRKAAALQGVRRIHGKSLDKPDAEPAGESCEALQSANAALRKQLDDAADQLASRQETLRALAEPSPVEKPPADTRISVNGRRTKTERARRKRQMILARGLGTTRKELRELRSEVVASQDVFAAHMAEALRRLASASASAIRGQDRPQTPSANSSSMAIVARVEQVAEMQHSVVNTLRELVGTGSLVMASPDQAARAPQAAHAPANGGASGKKSFFRPPRINLANQANGRAGRSRL